MDGALRRRRQGRCNSQLGAGDHCRCGGFRTWWKWRRKWRGGVDVEESRRDACDRRMVRQGCR